MNEEQLIKEMSVKVSNLSDARDLSKPTEIPVKVINLKCKHYCHDIEGRDTCCQVCLKNPVLEDTVTGSKKLFSPEDVGLALKDITDLEERAILSFILLGDVARAVKERRAQVSVDQIEMALSRAALTSEIKSLFKTWRFRETNFGYEYDFTPPLKWTIKIPVKIYVYKQKYALFDSPDRGWFGTDGFYIPNPFPKYWGMRQLIKAKLEKGQPLSSQTL